MVKAALVGRDNFIFGPDDLGIDEALDAVSQKGGLVNRFHG